ncbi:MAG: tetratricopeptide repeat protein [Myxococcales bacterium]|nr:tetratricopeptide repeat protein [Myxococcales bacterium]
MDQELYTSRDVARIFALTESRVLYWARTGFVGPSVKRGGRQYFTFQDLISVKAAKELLDQGVSLQAVRKNLSALRAALPSITRPLARLRVLSDGERLVVSTGDVPFEPLSGQLVMDFAVGALSTHVTAVMELPPRPTPEEPADKAPPPVAAPRTSYGWFLSGIDLEESDPAAAAASYRRALELDPALAAAHTNLGNLAHREGHRGEAREHYERALALDPEQPEARYNLANLLDELGEAEGAIGEWTRVVAACPEFADAHFNLGAALLREGEEDAGRVHVRRYLALDGEGEWAAEARALLDQPPAQSPA